MKTRTLTGCLGIFLFYEVGCATSSHDSCNINVCTVTQHTAAGLNRMVIRGTDDWVAICKIAEAIGKDAWGIWHRDCNATLGEVDVVLTEVLKVDGEKCPMLTVKTGHCKQGNLKSCGPNYEEVLEWVNGKPEFVCKEKECVRYDGCDEEGY